jgi:probable phosphoglycerate mutase
MKNEPSSTSRTPVVVLVRHGETEWSRTMRHTGRSDVPLTERGREQARLVGRRLAGLGRRFDLVLTSPLSRARETCELAGFGAGAETRPDLTEWDYGDYEGLTRDEIRAERPGWSPWEDGCPGGEDVDAVAARMNRVAGELSRATGDVAVFGHGHSLRVLAVRWAELPGTAGARLIFDTGALGVLGHDRDLAAILAWNDRAHLEA